MLVAVVISRFRSAFFRTVLLITVTGEHMAARWPKPTRHATAGEEPGNHR